MSAASVEDCGNDRPEVKSDQIVCRGQTHLRVRLPYLSLEQNDDQWQTKIAALSGVGTVRFNRAARSLRIDYDPDSISSDFETEVLHCLRDSLPRPDSIEPPAVIQTIETHQTVGYEIAHQTPWRIRLKIPRIVEDADYASRLVTLINAIKGISSVRVNSRTRSLTVEFESVTVDKAVAVRQGIFQAIEQALRQDGASLSVLENQNLNPTHSDQDWQRLGLPVLGLVMGMGTLVGLPIPGILTAAVMFTAAIPVFQRALEGIRDDRQLNIDFLDGLAISLHTYQASYFPAALMLGLIEGGELIRDMTARSSERASIDLLSCLNGEVTIERNGEELRISAKEIEVGDRVFLYPGDQIPIDGCILRGTALIDQCKLTGESVPVTRSEGDEVFASTLLMDGHLCVLAERIGSNTRAGIILTLVESAPVHDTRVENYAAAFANQLVVPTLLTAGIVGTLSGDLSRAIALLTLDLGTGIRISVPTTILSALTYAARNGVFIRSGRAIEVLAKIDTVVFDKTGTLTQGHAGITAIKSFSSQITETEILSLAATAEQGLTHPIAEAIVRHAREENAPLYDCEAWEYQVGLGVVATINGMRLLVGSHRLMLQENIGLEKLLEQFPDLQSSSYSPVYIAGNGELLGIILYSDPPRPESEFVIRELRDLGINAYMLSGDVTRVAKAVAHELGIAPDCVYAEAFPERKVEVVKALHDSGKTVAFCGDGINDSAALAYADVSISFAGATDIARETADVVLMEDDLRGFVHAVAIARQAMEIIWQNTAIVAIPNLGAVGAGVLFALDPVLAIIINNGSAILAELNGLRPLLGPGHSPALLPAPNSNQRSQESRPVKRGEPEPVQLKPDLHSSATSKISEFRRVESMTDSEEQLSNAVRLSQKDLAKRLGMTAQTLARRRANSDFDRWSQTKDPERVAWKYETESRLFYPVSSISHIGEALSSVHQRGR